MVLKKIVYLSSSTIPSKTANSVQVMKMSSAISELGCKVLLIVKSRKKNINNKIDVFKYYGVKENFIIKSFYSPKIKFSWVLYSYNCYKFVKNIQSDLIYSRDLFGAYLCVINGYRTIYECHTPPQKFWDKYFLRIFIIRGNSKIIVISGALKTILMNMYPFLNNSNIVIAHDGVDIKWLETDKNNFSLRKVLNFNDKDFIIGYVGSLYDGRGINLILTIASHLREDKFMIIGGNEEEVNKLKLSINNLKLQNVYPFGYVPNSKILRYLVSCTVLLMPYQRKLKIADSGINTSKYMSPLKMFEYMASGVPIISSDLPVLREVLNNNKNAILVHPQKINEWIHAIKKLKSNKSYSRQLAGNAMNDVKKYTWINRSKMIFNSIDL